MMNRITLFIKEIFKHRNLILFLLMYIVFSISLSKDIGIPWDESDVYARGKFLFEYMSGKATYAQYLQDVLGKWYNHFYSLFISLLNTRGTYGGYHFLNMLFAGFAYIASYSLVFSIYGRPGLAIWGPLMLLIVPRFLGDTPINPKDMPMATMFLVALWAIVVSRRVNLRRRAIFLGIIFGLAATTRILALILIPILVLSDIIHRKKVDITGYFVIVCFVFFILSVTWPYLGSNFFYHFREILSASQHYAWDGLVLYGGAEMPATKLPLSYLPVWIMITTPLFVLGFSTYAIFRAKKLWMQPAYFLLVTSLVSSFTLYFILNPVVYDGLRHFLYLLPLIATLAGIGMAEILTTQSCYIKSLALVVFIIGIFKTSWDVYHLYPHIYIYFNEGVGGIRGAHGRYETDYFGTSYKEAALWLRDNLPGDEKIYTIKTCGQTISSTHYFSPRMRWVADLKDADYLICYTRFNEHLQLPAESVLYTVFRDGVPLNYVKKNPDR